MNKNSLQFTKRESYFLVKLIQDKISGSINSSKKIVLCLSGGIDSECLARSFIDAQVPFEVVFLKFKNNLNMFDIKTNIEFCESKNIEYKFIDLDIIDFYESGKFFEVATKYECQSPQIAAHLWMLDQIDGAPFLSGNPMAPIWKGDHWFFVGLPGRLHSTYFKYFELNAREGEPWFFLSNPEIISRFMHLDCMRPYLNKQITSESQYTYLEKCKSYQQAGFDVKPRVDKFTGFELVRKYYDEKYSTQHGVTFDRLFRKPLEEKFPFPEQYIQMVPASYFPSHSV